MLPDSLNPKVSHSSLLRGFIHLHQVRSVNPLRAHMNTYTNSHTCTMNARRKKKDPIPVGRYNISFWLFLFLRSHAAVLVGTIVQCGGKVQNANDILQEKFQSCCDNHFYRIKSWPTSAEHISIRRECCSKIPHGLKWLQLTGWGGGREFGCGDKRLNNEREESQLSPRVRTRAFAVRRVVWHALWNEASRQHPLDSAHSGFICRSRLDCIKREVRHVKNVCTAVTVNVWYQALFDVFFFGGGGFHGYRHLNRDDLELRKDHSENHNIQTNQRFCVMHSAHTRGASGHLYRTKAPI